MYLCVDVLLENTLDQANVFVVGDTTTVVDLCAEEINYFIRDARILIEEHFELFLAYIQVFVREFVRDVPTDCTEFSSILNDRME